MTRTLLILNPMAGHGAALKMFPQVEAALHAAGVEFDVIHTRASLHAVQIAWEAPGKGYERILTVGGDGIVHEVLNGLMRASNEGETITLGIIPLGTGNDFIKSLPPALTPGKTRDDWHEAIPRVAGGKTALVDVGKIIGDVPAPGHPHPQYFTNGTDVGFGARVAKAVRNVPVTGVAAYLLAIMQVLVDYNLPRVKLTLDSGEVIELNTTMLAVTNGRCFGSSFWLTPMAHLDDGTFEILIAKALGRVGILQIIPLLMKGTHLDHPAIMFRKAQKAIIESPAPMTVEADGELPFLEARRLEIEILPKRLRVMV
ncbi:MAG: diacylglycerol kinase family lipid kinase [Chloroflexi bacterium]|nr:diacylglycerol kinase family lipid kinase [Chloroflexota bacterium]